MQIKNCSKQSLIGKLLLIGDNLQIKNAVLNSFDPLSWIIESLYWYEHTSWVIDDDLGVIISNP